MKNIKYILSVALIILTATSIRAQHRVMMNLNYSVNVPTGNFNEYIGKTSFRGWNASVVYRVTERFAIGGTVGFQDFYEKNDRALYKTADGSDISAVVSNSIQTIPVLATVQYTLTSSELVKPFVGVGAGANFIMHSQYLGQFANDHNKLGLAVRPEIGVFIPIMRERETGLNISGAYNFMPYNEAGVKNLNSWAIGLGAKFPLR